MFAVGDKVGLYEIVAELKSGGMASLFLGRRAGAAGFAKLVAIKVVHAHLAQDETFVQMFVDEALLSARIQHPNVVHVEELSELDGQLYLVMEFVYGCSLGQLLRELGSRDRRLSPELAGYIAIKVADGLHAAHETRDARGQNLGVVHRDVSPQNVLLAYQGNVKLIDFGVAKARGAAKTVGGNIKGKFRYMSPEQANAKPVDRRSDIYALGIVLWEMLTMRRRFHASGDMEILDLVRAPEPVAPTEFADDLPAGLDEVVMMAMAVDPEERFQTAMEFRQALAGVVPRAAMMHESELGSLLGVVMAERIVKDRDALPSNVSGVTLDLPVPSSSDAARTVDELTMGALDVQIVDSGETDAVEHPGEQPTRILDVAGRDASSDLHEQPTMMVSPPVGGTFGAADEEPTVFQPEIQQQMSEVAGTPAGVRVEQPAAGLHLGMLAAIAFGLLVIAGGGSFALVFALRDTEPDTRATVIGAPTPVAAQPMPDPEPTDAGPSTVALQPTGAATDAGVGETPTASSDPDPATTPDTPQGSGQGRGRHRHGTGSTTGQRHRGRPIASEW